MIFIDADAFIAFNSLTDNHHSRSVALFAKLKENDEELVTSWDVVSEVATKLSYYFTRRISLEFIQNIANSQIKVLYIDAVSREKVFKIFQHQSSKRVSMTDCVNVFLAREFGIKKFFSFDHHYIQNGFQLFGKI